MSALHYNDVSMGTIASQITSLTIVYSTVYSGADQSKQQSSASLAFVRGIHRRPVNSPHKWPVTRQMFPFDDVIMEIILHRAIAILFQWWLIATKAILSKLIHHKMMFTIVLCQNIFYSRNALQIIARKVKAIIWVKWGGSTNCYAVASFEVLSRSSHIDIITIVTNKIRIPWMPYVIWPSERCDLFHSFTGPNI